MNCDQVFDVLTRGPFPRGDDADAEVEHHLMRCAGCRRLAAALQPAVELFEETVTPEESAELPGYWGDLFSEEDASTAVERRSIGDAGSLTPSLRISAPEKDCQVVARYPARFRNRSLPTATTGMRLAVSLLLGVALGGALASWASPSRREAPVEMGQHLPSWRGEEAATNVASMAPQQWREVFGLAAACLSPRESSATVPVIGGGGQRSLGWNSPAEGAAHVVRCCSECHHAGSTTATVVGDQAVVAESCRVCHQI